MPTKTVTIAEVLRPSYAALGQNVLNTLALASEAYKVPLTLIIKDFQEYLDSLLNRAFEKAKEETLDS